MDGKFSKYKKKVVKKCQKMVEKKTKCLKMADELNLKKGGKIQNNEKGREN